MPRDTRAALGQEAADLAVRRFSRKLLSARMISLLMNAGTDSPPR
jgi:hypothetical protein